jgi:osmotically-inducible protein OsmY
MNKLPLFILLLALAGCTTTPAEKDAQPKLRALGQTIATDTERSDEAIGLDVRRQLDLINVANTAGVIVEVSDAIVTLRGNAPNMQAAWQATAAAQTVKGVKAVRNQILAPSLRPGY